VKACSAALQTALQQYTTTLAYLWQVTRVDGLVLGFTTHDQDIVFGGTSYQAETGLANSASRSSADLSVDNLEVTAFLSSASITEADILAGKYDNAAITIQVVDWSNLASGSVILRTGTLGIVKMHNGLFTAEIRGLAQKLTANIGATYGPICRATFGSGLNNIDMTSQYLCKYDVTKVRQSGSVSSVPNLRTIVPAAGLTGAAGWFNDGFLTFTSGALNGASFEVTNWDGSSLTLFVAMPVAPAPGASFFIEAGCDKTAATCQSKFSNIANFRGEPFIPGMDQLLDYASG